MTEPMTRQDAIHEIGAAFDAVCNQFCCGKCNCDEEFKRALFALGVTPGELDAAYERSAKPS